MIFGHIAQRTGFGAGSAIWKFWCNAMFFMMPWFFFKAGMFFSQKPIPSELKKTAKRLLIPFIIFSLCGIVLDMSNVFFHKTLTISTFIKNCGHSLFMNGMVPGNPPLWFLLSLFFSKNLLNIFSRKIPYLFIAIISMVIAIILIFIPLNLPTYLGNTFAGLFFLSMGHIAKNVQFKPAIFIPSILAFFLFLLIGIPQVDMRLHTVYEGWYILWFPAALSGIITLNILGKTLPLKKLKLYKIGIDSLNYYATHWLVILCISVIVKFLWPNSSCIFKTVAFVVGCLFFLPCVNYVIKFINNKALLANFSTNKIFH